MTLPALLLSVFDLITGRAPACATGSPNPSVLGAAPRRPANVSWGRGRQAMHLLCKQANMGALPIDSTISGSVAQSAEQPVVCGKAEGASPFGSANFTHLTAGPPTRVSGPVFLGSGVLLPVRSHQRVAWRQRTRLGAGNSRRAQAPGAIPAALTNLDCRRGLIDQPAVPLPGGVKVARRFVKPSLFWLKRPILNIIKQRNINGLYAFSNCHNRVLSVFSCIFATRLQQ